MALHEHENNSTTSSLYECIQLYINLGILKQTGLTLDKYLELPKEYILYINSIVVKANNEEGKVVNKLTEAFKEPKS